MEHLHADNFVLFVVIEDDTGRDFLGLDDLRIVEPEVERVGFLVHMESHSLPFILWSKNTLKMRLDSCVLQGAATYASRRDIVSKLKHLQAVQLTIEIPDELAKELGSDRERIHAILARGLRRSWSGASRLRREIISFLARRPSAEEIMEFRPPAMLIERSRQLLERNSAGTLTQAEEAELDEMCEVDRFVSLIKAEVLAQGAARG